MLVRTKLIAITIGTIGVGLFSQLLNISYLIVVLIPIGSVGISRYISSFYQDKKFDSISFLLKKVILINLPLSFLLTLIILVFSVPISKVLYSDEKYWYLILLFSFSIPLLFINALIEIVLRSFRVINLYVKYISLGSVLSLIVFLPVIYLYNIKGAAISFMMTTLVSIFIGLIIIKRNKLISYVKNSIPIDKSIMRNIYGTGFAMIIIYAVQQLSFIAVRSIIANSLSLKDLGIYQSVYAISNNYFALFFTIIYTYSFPKFSTFKKAEEITIETDQTLRFLVTLYTPLIIVFFVFRGFFVILLYSKEFSGTQNLLFFQLLGDFLKMLSWVFAIWLIPNLKIKAWAFFEIIFFVNFLGISYYMFYFTGYGIKSISISYFIAYFIHLILNFFYLKKSIDFKFQKNTLLRVIVSLLTLLTIFTISEISILLGYICFAPLLAIWFIICVKKEEILKLKSIFFKNSAKLNLNT